MTPMLAMIGIPGPFEMAIIGVIAVLLFGKRLPEVSRSFGKSILSFKAGMADVEKEMADIKAETTAVQASATRAGKAVADTVG